MAEREPRSLIEALITMTVIIDVIESLRHLSEDDIDWVLNENIDEMLEQYPHLRYMYGPTKQLLLEHLKPAIRIVHELDIAAELNKRRN